MDLGLANRGIRMAALFCDSERCEGSVDGYQLVFDRMRLNVPDDATDSEHVGFVPTGAVGYLFHVMLHALTLVYPDLDILHVARD
jgi:hypothetical protein